MNQTKYPLNQKIVGILIAIIGIGAFIHMINVGMPTPIIRQPIEAYLGIAFTIGWLTGAPAWLAYLLGALVFVLIAAVCYKLGSGVYGLVVNQKN